MHILAAQGPGAGAACLSAFHLVSGATPLGCGDGSLLNWRRVSGVQKATLGFRHCRLLHVLTGRNICKLKPHVRIPSFSNVKIFRLSSGYS